MSSRQPIVDERAGISPRDTARDVVLKTLVVMLGAALVVVGYGSMGGGRVHWLQGLGGELWQWVYWPSVVMGTTVLASFAWRALLWWRYRPVAPIFDDDALPTVTVVIPAFNEGPMVTRSILSAIASDYPKSRLRVVCVDDGSKDDTYLHMERARAAAADRVTTLRLPQNRGKRHALYEGLASAPSDVLVTLDSDSVLPRHALRALVAPLVVDPGVGSVAGCVKVYNRDENLLTRMLGIRYLLGFDFTRAYQSELGTVLCAPGALTAYRRSAIAPHLDAWRNQTFLGARCTNGDDHALTNVVLRSGWTTRYQGNAEVLTVVPETWRRLSRMYVRWARSNVRESTLYLRFGHRRAFARREWLAWIDALVHFLQIPARIWLSLVSTVLFFAAPHLVIRALAAATVVALVYGLVSLRSERGTESVYGVLYAWMTLLTMHWIYPWAALTVRKNQWLTRGAGGALEPAARLMDNGAHVRRLPPAHRGERASDFLPIAPPAPSPPGA